MVLYNTKFLLNIWYHLQAYIDEYTYRFNRSFMKDKIFENLMKRMVKAQPCPYKIIII